MPADIKHKGARFGVIARQVIGWHIHHERRDLRNFKRRWPILCWGEPEDASFEVGKF